MTSWRSFEALCENTAVLIPAYNASLSVARAAQSARAAGIRRVIVVDDGSTDATAEVALAAGCHVIRQRNSGAAEARRRGLSEVGTQFVALLDADDAMDAVGMRHALHLLDGDRQIGVVGGQTNRVARLVPQFGRGHARVLGLSTAEILNRTYSPFPPSAAMWRVDALNAAEADKPEPLRPRFAEDFEMLIRVSLVSQVVLLKETMCEYDLRGGKSVRNAHLAVLDSERVRRHYAERVMSEVTLMTPREIEDQANWRVFKSSRVAHGDLNAMLKALVNFPLALSLTRHARHEITNRLRSR